jgi:hypothetical protein
MQIPSQRLHCLKVDKVTRETATDIRIGMLRKSESRFSLLFLLILLLALPAPALGYSDPSGGLLFQTLTPILAALWGMWMIFANAIRKWLKRVIGRKDLAAPDNASGGKSHEADVGD